MRKKSLALPPEIRPSRGEWFPRAWGVLGVLYVGDWRPPPLVPLMYRCTAARSLEITCFSTSVVGLNATIGNMATKSGMCRVVYGHKRVMGLYLQSERVTNLKPLHATGWVCLMRVNTYA